MQIDVLPQLQSPTTNTFSRMSAIAPRACLKCTASFRQVGAELALFFFFFLNFLASSPSSWPDALNFLEFFW